jgi:hypothetical protein
MPHRSSSAALHAARVLLQHWIITPKPPGDLKSGSIHNLKANEAHLSIVIDLASNAYHVALVRPELSYWQKRMTQRTATAPGIGNFVHKLIAALEMIPHAKYEEELEQFAPDVFTRAVGQAADVRVQNLQKLAMTRAATEATRYALHYYTFERKVTPVYSDEMLDRIDIGKSIDVSLGLRHALKALPMLRRVEPLLKEGQMKETEIRACLRHVGVYLGQMPHFADREDEVKLLV